MFNDDPFFENAIKKLLSLFSIEEVLELLEITPDRVLEILLVEGHCTLVNAPFLRGLNNEELDSTNDRQET